MKPSLERRIKLAAIMFGIATLAGSTPEVSAQQIESEPVFQCGLIDPQTGEVTDYPLTFKVRT